RVKWEPGFPRFHPCRRTLPADLQLVGTECKKQDFLIRLCPVPLPDPETLQQLQISLVPQRDCRQTYPWLTDDMLCAGSPAGGKDACKGDYGGPLVCRTPRGFVQVGIMSSGSPDGCGLPGRPGVYTRVSSYLAFIKSNINRGGKA
uniref:Peptidase S1 domain-containing protein n=1 Tax=Oryzias latipes TaxID=8090 RepID=A0A3P9J7F0_ORYLA